MKKVCGIILFAPLLLLSSCGKEEVYVQPIPDVRQQYNYIDTNVPVIDAIIDTEAEKKYMLKIHTEYEKFLSHYEGLVSTSSALTTTSAPQTIASTKEGVTALIADLEHFKNRMTTIDLPSDYRSALVASLNAFIQSLSSEKTRLSQSADSEAKPSNELYQYAQDTQKKAKEVYQKIMTS